MIKEEKKKKTMETTKYVLQNANGQFYRKSKSTSSSWGFTKDSSKAYIFDSEKDAKSRLDIVGEGAVILKMTITLEEI